jgi:hypothetical protein
MTLETLQAVERELLQRGVPATLEYPGTIQISQGLNVTLVFGDANETFGCDVTEADGSVIENIDTTIPSDSTDVQRIAGDIACTYSEALAAKGAQ